MARLSSALLGIVVVLTLSTTIYAAPYSGGSGTAEDPYMIATGADLIALSDTPADYNKNFVMIVDIDLSGVVLTPIARDIDCDYSDSSYQGTPFSGVFNGNGHKIIHPVFDLSVCDYVGLFGQINPNGQVHNLGVENANIQGHNFVGGLVGNNLGTITSCYITGTVSGTRNYVGGMAGMNYGTITSCYATGPVTGTYENIGGLVGRNAGVISDCYSTGSVSGGFPVGGLLGYNYYGEISNCYSTGSVSGNINVGGLVGENSFSTITSCYATGSVVGGSQVGGLVGANDRSDMSYCYSTGSVSGGSDRGGGSFEGGLAAYNYYGKITSCYATGSVKGTDDNVGGLLGYNYYGEISNCYSTGSVSGDSLVGGLCGGNTGTISGCFWDTETSNQTISDGGTGKTTADMKQLSTFIDAGWDFVGETQNGTLDTWVMPKNGYPLLSWQWQHQVDAGMDVWLKYPPDRVPLAGHIKDDTVLGPNREIHWSLVSGPSAVAFDPNENVLDPTVILSLAGEYILRLTVDAGVYQSFDEMKITYSYDTVFVDSSAAGFNNGSSWPDAFTSLQDALSFASAGNEIRVAQGTYKPDQFNLLDRVSRGRLETYALKSGIILKGGYAGNTAINPDDRDPAKYPTILSGDLSGNDNPAMPLSDLREDPTRTDNAYHVLTAVGVGNTALLDGFIISGGHADSATAPDHRGGGLNIEQSSPTVTNCIFTRNYGSIGGAVCTRNAANAVFSACRFVANAGYSGGAVLNDGNVTFTDCTFTGNYAAFGGGLLAEAPIKLTRCLIAQNTATYDGGGIQNYASPTTLTNCTLANNSAARSGGGVFSVPAGKFNIVNSILWGNKASGVADKAAQLTGGTAAIYYCTIQDWDGSDPLFADPAAGDYRLKSKAGRYDPTSGNWINDTVTSPGIDAGSPFDPIGSESAPNGSRINQGFDGGTEFASKSPDRNTADLNHDGKVNMIDLCIVAENWLWED